MAELQTITAAVNLAQLSVDAGQLIRRVIRGVRAEADTLSRRTKHVANLADNIAETVRMRQEFRDNGDESLYASIQEALDGCNQALSSIKLRLERFPDDGNMTLVMRVVRNLGFITSEEFFRAQEHIIERHLGSLAISLNMLICRDLSLDRRPSGDRAPNSSRAVQQDTTSRWMHGLIIPQLETETDGEHFGGSQHHQDVYSESPFISAIRRQDAASVRQLIEAGVDIKEKDIDGRTFLHHAAVNPDKEILRLLWNTSATHCCAFLNEQTNNGETALMIAAYDVEDPVSIILVRFLVMRGCDVNIQDKADRSALYIAADGPIDEDRIRLVGFLCDNGANFECLKTELRTKYDDIRRKAPVLAERLRRNSEMVGSSRPQSAPPGDSAMDHAIDTGLSAPIAGVRRHSEPTLGGQISVTGRRSPWRSLGTLLGKFFSEH